MCVFRVYCWMSCRILYNMFSHFTDTCVANYVCLCNFMALYLFSRPGWIQLNARQNYGMHSSQASQKYTILVHVELLRGVEHCSCKSLFESGVEMALIVVASITTPLCASLYVWISTNLLLEGASVSSVTP